MYGTLEVTGLSHIQKNIKLTKKRNTTAVIARCRVEQKHYQNKTKQITVASDKAAS